MRNKEGFMVPIVIGCLLFSASFYLYIPGTASALSCAFNGTVKEQFADSPAVFEGVAKSYGQDESIAYLQVTKSWKGPKVGSIVPVTYGPMVLFYERGFSLGEKYFIFASKGGQPPYYGGPCSIPPSDFPGGLIAELDHLTDKSNPPRTSYEYFLDLDIGEKPSIVIGSLALLGLYISTRTLYRRMKR